MRKLKLDLNELAVEAFDTAAVPAMRGTVEGEEQYTYFCDTDECTGPNGTSCNMSRCNTCYTCPPASRDFTACCV
jgi:hypothetical protein